MTNLILMLVIAVLLGISIGYIYRQKKKGNHCIGCPYSGSCEGCEKILYKKTGNDTTD